MRYYNMILVIFFMLFLGGCRVFFYGAVGHQSARRIEVDIEGQEADPNIPIELINAGLLK